MKTTEPKVTLRPDTYKLGSEAEGPAARALAEAEARRLRDDRRDTPRPREIDGRPGPEPVRYGDWENRGIASDF